ncbi:hypothetical protein CCR85_01840 [Rhodothalassium salexigens]|uniref:penicillin-binding protein activator n=1 Tax=Rhodothalassium salexigens TaxID=1086 RepID=UPI001911B40C|nr:penicillin-binding protein activator [Rhodothalassium salexigens]MBK5910233.1 hypothetical protein [Rhodothalassium salexigens]
MGLRATVLRRLHPAALASLLVLSGCAASSQAPSTPAAPPASAQGPDMGALLLDDGSDVYRPAVTEDTGRQITVALLAPLTGRGERVGAALRDAAVMALFDAYDPRLDLRVFDTGGQPDGAERAARQAVDAGARLILGPLYGASVKAAGPIALAADIPLVGFSNDRAVAGNGVYLLSYLPEQQVARVARYAAAQGHRAFAALVPEGDYGDRALAALGRALDGTRADLTRVESHPRTVEGVYEPVKRLADYDRRRAAYRDEVAFLRDMEGGMAADLLADLAGKETLGALAFDTVLIPEGPPLVRTIATLLPFYEVDTQAVRVLGTMRWDGVDLSNEPAMVGAWYAAPDPERVDGFLDRFDRVYGERPPRLATLGYDAMALAAVLARDFDAGEISRADLEDGAGFSGVGGLFRFRRDGTAERALAILEVVEGGATVIDAPPGGFYTLN